MAVAAILLSLAAGSAGAQITQTEYAQRRAALAKMLGDGVLVAYGSPEPDQDYLSFFQNSTFTYLSGVKEPGATLVMRMRGGEASSVLFVQPLNPAREVWTGRRMGATGAQRATGIPAREAKSLLPFLDSLLATERVLHVLGAYDSTATVLSADDQAVRALKRAHPRVSIRSAQYADSALRRTKSAAEVDLIRKAASITVTAQREAMRLVEPGMNEFEVQALVEYTFRRNGADRPSFATIIGSGPNSTTLHYNANDRFIEAGDMIVMDIGASYRGYAADVTRTIPANGRFGPAQREIYQAVRDAQAAAERQARVGLPVQQMSDSATAVVAAALARLGLIESPDATYDCTEEESGTCRQYRIFYMHGLGHGIGLDVHDPRTRGNLALNDAFSIEPGIYVRENTIDIIADTPRNRALKQRIRTAVRKYANIGVRIEDDYIMTARGADWISRAPREISDIEAIMRETWTAPRGRDSSTVEWYRSTDPRGSAQPSVTRQGR